jgi:hypothetical protein
MISANGWSRRGLLAGASILTAAGTAAAKEDRLTEGVVILIDSNEPMSWVMRSAILPTSPGILPTRVRDC